MSLGYMYYLNSISVPIIAVFWSIRFTQVGHCSTVFDDLNYTGKGFLHLRTR